MTDADAWATALADQGFVEIGLRRRRAAASLFVIALILLVSGFMALGFMGVFGMVVGILAFAMVFFLGFLPHLEVATSSGPPLRIDSTGIRISRWKSIDIAWDEVVGVRAQPSTRTRQSLVIHVIPEFFNEYQRSKMWPLRVTDDFFATFTGSGFSVPTTIDANPQALAAWLDSEVERRSAS